MSGRPNVTALLLRLLGLQLRDSGGSTLERFFGSSLAQQLEPERARRCRRFGARGMVGDSVRQVSLARSMGVGGADPLDKAGGEAGIAAAVGEDAAVGQVGQQSSSVGDADRGVQRDGLPDTVNLSCGDTVLG